MDAKCKTCDVELKQDYVHGEYFCELCGEVYNNVFKQDRPDNISSNFQKEGYTSINVKNIDYQGKHFDLKRRREISNMRLWQNRVKSNTVKERNLIFAQIEADRIVTHFNLSEMFKNKVVEIYKTLSSENLTQGKSIPGLMSALVYIVAIFFEIPYTLDEIAEVSKVKKRRITKLYRLIIKHINLEIKLPGVINFIPRYIGFLDVTDRQSQKKIETTAYELLEHLKYKAETGKGPLATTCALLYISCKLQNTPLDVKKFISNTKITNITLNNKLKYVLEALLESEDTKDLHIKLQAIFNEL